MWYIFFEVWIECLNFVTRSLLDVHEISAGRADHVCLSASTVELENRWTDFDEIWSGGYPIGVYPKVIILISCNYWYQHDVVLNYLTNLATSSKKLLTFFVQWFCLVAWRRDMNVYLVTSRSTSLLASVGLLCFSYYIMFSTNKLHNRHRPEICVSVWVPTPFFGGGGCLSAGILKQMKSSGDKSPSCSKSFWMGNTSHVYMYISSFNGFLLKWLNVIFSASELKLL
jgi:hypothetical protein